MINGNLERGQPQQEEAPSRTPKPIPGDSSRPSKMAGTGRKPNRQNARPEAIAIMDVGVAADEKAALRPAGFPGKDQTVTTRASARWRFTPMGQKDAYQANRVAQ
jgi:hypothetical protein